MGGGIAFPHGRINLIQSPLISIGLSPKNNIMFPSKTKGRKISTNFVYMLLLPSTDFPANISGKSKKYIETIAEVAKFLKILKSGKLIKNFKNKKQFLDYVSDYKEKWIKI